MQPRRELIVLDRDGVINYDSDAYIKSPDEWHPYPGSLEAIARLFAAGFEIVVATNQSGIGRGLFERAALDAIHRKMHEEIGRAGGRLAGVYVCPHHPDDGCACRKPAPGLLLEIAADRARTLEGVRVVGDKLSDLEAALAAGAKPVLVRSGRGAEVELPPELSDVETYPDLAALADALLGAC